MSYLTFIPFVMAYRQKPPHEKIYFAIIRFAKRLFSQIASLFCNNKPQTCFKQENEKKRKKTLFLYIHTVLCMVITVLENINKYGKIRITKEIRINKK